MTWRRALIGLAILVTLGVGWVVASSTCWSARIRFGVNLRQCPAGRMQPALLVSANGLRRGSPGWVRLRPRALYTRGWSTGVQSTAIHRGRAKLLLQTTSSTITLEPEKSWERNGGGVLSSRITLPADLPDGLHRLVAEVDTPLGPARATMALPVFAPARVLVLTDRPLYEAGNVIQFRAVVLRAKDQSPLDGRPGTWFLEAPDGTVVYEERAPAGAYGVVAGDFPLDDAAQTGTWTLSWRSGDDFGTTTFRVEPFELPRFTIEASAARPVYGRRDQPVVRGTVRYTSGAPVTDAAVSIDWRVSGRWPAPPTWVAGALPRNATTDAQGRFELRLPAIPADLMGRATLSGAIAATDAAGDRVTGAVSVLLSEDKIQVATVTELADGLVEGFNNRLYLRATTASGSVLGQTSLRIRRAWDSTDPGQVVKTDVDGVAALQIDPGPAVTVIEPSFPVRAPLPPPPVTRLSMIDHLRDEGAMLADQLVLDKAPLARCARLQWDQARVRSVLRVSSAGTVDEVSAGSSALGRCVQDQLRRLTFSKGPARLLELRHRFKWSGPTVSLTFDGPDVPTDPWRREMGGLAVRARACLPARATDAALGQLLTWHADDSGRVSLRVVPEPRGGPRQPAAVTACIMQTLRAGQSKTLADLGVQAPYAPAFGLVRATVEPALSRRTPRRTRQTYLGYELDVEAFAGDETIGKTKVRLRPGSIPRLRLRATPVVAKPGETVEVKVLRGPDFAGELPEEMKLVNEGYAIEADLDPATRVARFELPSDRVGWYEVQLFGAKAVVFVPEQRSLSVDIAADKPVYKPRERAVLTVKTTAGGAGVPAMVGLFGVDQTLSQLAPLPGPDVWTQLLTVPSMSSPAFGALDAVALASGRVQGDAALAATVLRVTQVPSPAAIDRPVSVSVDTYAFDPVVPMTDSFYGLLERLGDRVRKWDEDTPKDQLMTPDTMAGLWDEVLASAPAEMRNDPFDRPLKLRILPDDLLALVDPRVVVTNGTRLPEDVDNWIRWVRRNRG